MPTYIDKARDPRASAYYPAAAHAQSGVNNRFCLSVCQSVVKKILKSVLCVQYTALKNIGIREKRIYFPSWAPVSFTWLFLGSASRSKNLIAKFALPTVIANYVQIRMECTDDL